MSEWKYQNLPMTMRTVEMGRFSASATMASSAASDLSPWGAIAFSLSPFSFFSIKRFEPNTEESIRGLKMGDFRLRLRDLEKKKKEYEGWIEWITYRWLVVMIYGSNSLDPRVSNQHDFQISGIFFLISGVLFFGFYFVLINLLIETLANKAWWSRQ